MNIQSLTPQVNFKSKVIGKEIGEQAVNYAFKKDYKSDKLALALKYLNTDGRSDILKLSKCDDGGIRVQTSNTDSMINGKFKENMKYVIDSIINFGMQSADKDGKRSFFSEPEPIAAKYLIS